MLTHPVGQAAVAGPAAPLRDEAIGAFESEVPAEALDLAKAEVELLTRYVESQGAGIRPRFRAAARLGPTWVLRVPGRLAARMPL